MSIDKITELKLKAAHQLAEMRRILDENQDGLTAEQAQEYDRREVELDETNALALREERAAGIAPEPKFNEVRSMVADSREDVDVDEGVQVAEKRDTNAAFDAFLRSAGRDVESRATLKVGTSTEPGGYLAPEEWQNQIIRSLASYTKLLDVANVINTSDGNPLHIPTVTADEAAALIAEEGAYTELAPTITETVIGSYKYGYMSRVSEELVTDSLFDISSFVRDQAARAIGVKLATVLATGTGSSQPQGINQCTVGVTAASATATTSDEVINTQHALAAPYRANAAWFVNDTWLRNVRKLTASGSGNYLLEPALSAGAPATLLGSPVYIEQLAAPATTTVPAVYGDPKSYTIRRVGGIEVRALDQVYAANGQIGFKVGLRLDAKITDASGLRSFKQA
jgi:HK97 family phage major capsid protein